MNDQKNTILAIVLSAIVLIGWQYFIGLPQMERQKQDALLKQQTQQAQPPQAAPNAGAPAPQGGGRVRPGRGPQQVHEEPGTKPDSRPGRVRHRCDLPLPTLHRLRPPWSAAPVPALTGVQLR